MRLENEFTVGIPIDQVWETMLDLKKVMACLPGTAFAEETGGEYKGTMKVRFGPVAQEYNGAVNVEEANEEARRAVYEAKGKDANGQGTAAATITAILREENGSTRIRVETNVRLTGPAARFDRGVQQDVAGKLVSQFAECLEEELTGENVREEPAVSTNGSAESSGEEQQLQRETAQQGRKVEPLDPGETGRDTFIKRVAPVAVGAVALALLFRLIRHR